MTASRGGVQGGGPRVDDVQVDDVLVDKVSDGVTLVTLNRPRSLNALLLATVARLHRALDEIAADSSVRVVILTGAGRGFCAGGDFSDVETVDADSSTVQQAMSAQQSAAALIPRLITLPQPVIAAVNGPAAGGGLALALACDTRICAQSAHFSTGFIKIGLTAEMGVSYLLPRLIGPTAAFEMALTGRRLPAAEAAERGLVHRLVPDGTVVDAALETAEQIVQNTPFGVRMMKRVLWANSAGPGLSAAMELENSVQMLCARSADHQEALSATRERRAPVFADK
jgi:enoyl-CoA hydratase